MDVIRMPSIDAENMGFTLYFANTLDTEAKTYIKELLLAWCSFGQKGGFGGFLICGVISENNFNHCVFEWRLDVSHLLHKADRDLGESSFLLQSLVWGLKNLVQSFPYLQLNDNPIITSLVIGLHPADADWKELEEVGAERFFI